jgi:hypothetical protein
VVPLAQFYQPPLQGGESRHWYRFQPAARQHGGIQEIFTEAVVGVPGSGMVAPDPGLGYLRLSIRVTLDPAFSRLEPIAFGAVSALYYRSRHQAGAGEAAEEAGTGEEESAGPDPRILKHNMVRLKRCFASPPHLLLHPVTAAYLLPLVHIYVSFHVLPRAGNLVVVI